VAFPLSILVFLKTQPQSSPRGRRERNAQDYWRFTLTFAIFAPPRQNAGGLALRALRLKIQGIFSERALATRYGIRNNVGINPDALFDIGGGRKLYDTLPGGSIDADNEVMVFVV